MQLNEHQAQELISQIRALREENEKLKAELESKEDKPKRKRRTKAEIEADEANKKSKEEAKGSNTQREVFETQAASE